MRAKCVVEYHGAAYSGWQSQPDRPTVQAALEHALKVATGVACSVEGAGRTDAGVSALAQVAAFDLPDGTDLYRLRASLNGLTARDISVVDLTEVPASFDPRRDAVSRTYRYTVVCGRPPSPMLADRSWHVYPDLDESLLQELADMVVGTHDFAAFRSADCDSSSTERQILSSRWRRDGHVLVYEVSVG
ncbi:MAG: tRNA pseudouridine synthase A [Candidatus Binatia bacterium]